MLAYLCFSLFVVLRTRFQRLEMVQNLYLFIRIFIFLICINCPLNFDIVYFSLQVQHPLIALSNYSNFALPTADF